MPSLVILVGVLLWLVPPWPPGLDVRDGRHDLGRNGIWLQHGWLGDDGWFERYGKQARRAEFRSPAAIAELARRLASHGISDVFPHLCPADSTGRIAPVDAEQVERFLDAFHAFRVLPWIGGARDGSVVPDQPEWRAAFADSVADLLRAHPRLGGVHVNVEPCPSGSEDFLLLLDDVRRVLPAGKLLSVAAYPPPTILHPHPEVHWEERYFRSVADRVDQLAVMMYDTGLRHPHTYQRLMAQWTREVFAWSGRAEVLLGLPAYDDEGVGYHHPRVENLTVAIPGIHAGLASAGGDRAGYRGIALYCEWEMDEDEWRTLHERFLRPGNR